MKPFRLAALFAITALASAIHPAHAQDLNGTYARDPKQPIDQAYTDKILKYTTDKQFISPLVNYLPAA